ATPPPGAAAAAGTGRTVCPRHTPSYVHLLTRLCREVVSSLQLVAKLDQTAGNATRDRARREFELLADRPVRLVAGEEAVENLAAVVGQPTHRLVHVERLIDPRDRVLVGVHGELALVGYLLPGSRAQLVEADAPGQLRDPRLDRVVAPERV